MKVLEAANTRISIMAADFPMKTSVAHFGSKRLHKLSSAILPSPVSPVFRKQHVYADNLCLSKVRPSWCEFWRPRGELHGFTAGIKY